MARCQATTKAGKPCRAPASAGGLCFLHANPTRARELGRVGGRKNRQQVPELPAAKSMTLAQLNEVLIGTLHDVRSKKVSARRASTVVQVCAALQRMLPAGDLEARLSRLEEQVAEQAVASAAEVVPDSGPVNGSTAPDDTELAEPAGKLGTTSEEEAAERTPAASDVEHGASSNNEAATKEEIATAKPNEKLT